MNWLPSSAAELVRHSLWTRFSRSFARKDIKDRHDREQHYDSNCNFAYVENLDSLTSIECTDCDQTFKRKSDLKRHFKCVHNEKKDKYPCEQCTAQFSRKDSLTRHVKTKHSSL